MNETRLNIKTPPTVSPQEWESRARQQLLVTKRN